MITAIFAVEEETREVFEDINVTGKVVFYILSLTATALFLWGWWKRVTKYRGRPTGWPRSRFRGRAIDQRRRADASELDQR